ncbi:hypothetical protein IOD13_16640 [Brevibacterium casei]|nr:hypothetical protein [Brevibacterium casei]
MRSSRPNRRKGGIRRRRSRMLSGHCGRPTSPRWSSPRRADAGCVRRWTSILSTARLCVPTMISCSVHTSPDALLYLIIDEGVPSSLELAPLDDSVAYAEFPPAERIEF